MITTPAFNASSSVRANSAIPPPNNLENTSFIRLLIASKLSWNLVFVSESMVLIAPVSFSRASVKSLY